MGEATGLVGAEHDLQSAALAVAVADAHRQLHGVVEQAGGVDVELQVAIGTAHWPDRDQLLTSCAALGKPLELGVALHGQQHRTHLVALSEQ